uniref:Uncharacterized protein n=1 Tax=Chromera velia CCMP2878 TaxID=1169474 RepID=A0A0G4EZ71_9ALVE|eukprot:Cvel_2529.t1-p1 / transcript=Cvel_2529.t1 / gene=Cvel_2529 / organism=Chromera_velia_CCMP2878 / gene_product=Guanine nucleotide-binding protein subunit, putative / transcript_product=Guanine nucleotide-binding protein subunit, putative / location=Cvel_scaffold100:1080-15480(-) / protein_length=650 / sequence_SO=supercontig / SO=protein_coding / is_pseudo=false
MYDGHMPQSGWKRAFLEGLRKRDEATKPYESLMNEYMTLVFRLRERGGLGISRGAEGGGGGDGGSLAELQGELERLTTQTQKLTERNTFLQDQLAEANEEAAKFKKLHENDQMKIRRLELERYENQELAKSQEHKLAENDEIIKAYEQKLEEQEHKERTLRNEIQQLTLGRDTLAKEREELTLENHRVIEELLYYKEREAERLNEMQDTVNTHMFRKARASGVSSAAHAVAIEENMDRSGIGEGDAETSGGLQLRPSSRSQIPRKAGKSLDAHDTLINRCVWGRCNHGAPHGLLVTAGGGGDGQLTFVDIEHREILKKEFATPGGSARAGGNYLVDALALTDDCACLAVAFADSPHPVLCINVDSMRRTFEPVNVKSRVIHMSICKKGNKTLLFTALDDRTCKLWDFNKGSPLHSLSVSSKLTSAAVSRDFETAVTGHRNGTVMILSLRGNKIHRIEEIRDEHTQEVTGVKISEDMSSFVTQSKGEDNTVKVWDLRAQRVELSVPLDEWNFASPTVGHACADIAPDGDLLVIPHKEGILCYNRLKKKEESSISLREMPLALEWTPFGVVSGSKEGRLTFWDGATPSFSTSFSPTGDAGALEAFWVLWVSPLPLVARELMGALVELAVSTRASAWSQTVYHQARPPGVSFR